MGKKLVLGNDPFQRGAAPRPPPPTQPAARQTLAVEGAVTPPRALPPKAPEPTTGERVPAKGPKAGTPARAVERAAPKAPEAAERPRASKPPAAAKASASTPAGAAAKPATAAAAAKLSAPKPAAGAAAAAKRSAAAAATAGAAATSRASPAPAAVSATKPSPSTPAPTRAAPAKPDASTPAAEAPAPAPDAAGPRAAASPLAQPAELPALLAVADAPPFADGLAAAAVALQRLVGLGGGAPSLDVDEFGRDAAFSAEVRPLLEWIGARWFRCDVAGAAKLPARGPLVLVANRAGTIPWDAAMIALATARAGRPVRPLLEDAIFHLPALGVLFARMGAVRACPENAERILADGGATLVFPEGANGFGKPFAERYRLQRFGRGGFVKLALRTGARIVPVAVVGSEESQPLLARLPRRLLSLPFTPVTPTFPALGPLGLVPLPTKWHLELADAIDLSNYGPSAADDDALVMRLAEQVRGTIQAMLDAQLATRRSVFGG